MLGSPFPSRKISPGYSGSRRVLYGYLSGLVRETDDDGSVVQVATVKTLAVCAISRERVELRDVEIPDLGPNDVLVRAYYSIISTGTERWVITGQFHPPGDTPISWPLGRGARRSALSMRLEPTSMSCLLGGMYSPQHRRSREAQRAAGVVMCT